MALDYLSSLLTKEEFFEKIYSKSNSKDSEGNARSYIAALDYYSLDKYYLPTEKIMSDLRSDLKKNGDISKASNYLNNFVLWLSKDHENIIISKGKNKQAKTFLKKKNPNSITAYFSMARRYLKLCGGIRINDDDVRDFITIPRSITDDEDAEPITLEIARDIIANTKDPKRRTMYYFMKDTGFRISETGLTQKKHIHLEMNPPSVFIPKINSKGKVASSWVYLTGESAKRISILIKNMTDDDFVFKRYNEQPLKSFRENELELIRLVYDKLGLVERYAHNNRYKYNLHSWRAFCATQFSKNTSEELAHGYIRHKKYLAQYIRKTDEEKRELFKKASVNLTLDESERKQMELDKALKENYELELRNRRIEDLEKRFEKELVKDKEMQKIKDKMLSHGYDSSKDQDNINMIKSIKTKNKQNPLMLIIKKPQTFSSFIKVKKDED